MSVEFLFIPKVLPLAPRPMSDELLSSWLCRVATANALSFGELLESARNGYLPRPAGTIDLGLPTAWRIRLSTFCRIPESWIRAIDLQSHFQVEISPGSRTNAYFAPILANPLCSSPGHFAFTADTINANDTARSILTPTGHLRSELTARAIYLR